MQGKVSHQEGLVKEYVNAIRSYNGLEELNDEDLTDKNEMWSVAEFLNVLKKLTDNFVSFKSNSTGNGFKVPSIKLRKIF